VVATTGYYWSQWQVQPLYYNTRGLSSNHCISTLPLMLYSCNNVILALPLNMHPVTPTQDVSSAQPLH
jgi:hypothetical protein